MLQQRFERNIEERWQKLWEEEGTFRFDETDNTKPVYSIDTPPPFTSGELHMGHVLSYSFIDFVARYKRMRGFNVYYPQGWDSQGFPTEVKVEKKFGRLPQVQFREKCIEWTREFIARMRAQMQQMGFSPDWRFEYRTMEPEYHRKVQLSLIRMYANKLVYMSKYPVYWCPKCVSAIAKAELDDLEKDGTLNYVKFGGPDGEELVVATTRPELLHACVAVMFNPADERYKRLEGKRITTPLGKEVPAIGDKDIDKEFGTGLVMLCTFGDKMDVVWMHRYKLPMIEGIDRYGKLLDAGEFTGKKVEEAKKLMLEKLEREGKVVKKEPLKQTVKVHDRCGTAIELITSLQWFADIRSTAKNIKAMAGRIGWVPDFGISYLIDWVESAEWDWVISRQRVFGTPLPFYYCEKCLATAAADEDGLPFYPEKAKHKPCSACGQPMKPETSTCDVWVDSSITPLIISGWPDDEARMQKLYPASLRPQGVEIVRTWAFYTIFRSGVALTGVPPWKQILLNGNVLAPDGKKMSKSLGNIVSPSDLLRDYPADAIRQWAALSGAMAKDRPFSYEDIKYAKSFLGKVWNAARFVESSAKEEVCDAPALRMTDRWILGRLAALTRECTEHLERFEYHYAIGKIQRFFWQDVCDNYIEYVKYRIYEGEDLAARYTLRKVMYDSIRLMAPFTPHIAEEIYREVFCAKESVQKAGWPDAGNEYAGDAAKVAVLNEIVSQLRQHKSRNKLPQNAELAKVRLSLQDGLDPELIEELKKISHVGDVEIIKGEFSVSAG
ncbi:valine--tRNA ligase [Candidatus Micrarchaeota archaeon]|nr:valine--tRNA ligase [Candidatus Micrarchaeota archaeon]